MNFVCRNCSKISASVSLVRMRICSSLVMSTRLVVDSSWFWSQVRASRSSKNVNSAPIVRV